MSRQYVIGLDIGGTKIRGGLWNGEKIIADYELATPHDNLDHFLVMVKAVVDPLLEKATEDKVKVAGIGIGMPGQIDSNTGKLYGSPNLIQINEKPVVSIFKKIFNSPFVIENDANAFTRGEAIIGTAKQYKSVYGITLGTGVGSGWWINGDIFRGSFGGGNEAGCDHINTSTGLDFESSFHRLMQNNPEKVSQEAILGDVLAQKAFEEFGRDLGILMADIVNLIEPEVFVLGGSVIDSSDLFLSETKKTLKENILYPFTANKIKILKSKLKENAGVIGAALLVK